ncbi:MAG: T9SS type A sorting domain-containing protein [candidate division Zixibacteria bacterium]|nr:T9SS type A sorting domain-containing protein [candidate division Zixibacteria bacterium]
MKRYFSIFTFIFIVFYASDLLAQTPYNTIPDWLSIEEESYGTGCDFGDINRDGFLDLAVSNGNDMALAPNYIYLNEFGFIPTEAAFISEDSLYSGHCEFGDIDNDGYPEIMVANYISEDWHPGSVQIYDNVEGQIEGLPSWITADSVYSFRATFGDPDGDGDLDLAVATGEAYHEEFRRNLIFYNNDGVLATTPGWISADYDAAYDVQFVDIDNDGDQDVAFLTSGGPVKIYYNYGDSIETLPTYTTYSTDNGNSFDFADVNGDGYLDMGVANNTQLDGSGLFKIYYSDNGSLPPVEDWQSYTSGYGSEAVFCDIDGDGDQDFITGRWFGLVYIYLNNDGEFGIMPTWQCDGAYELVVENIVFADIDYAQEILQIETFTGDGVTRLFHLSDRYIQGIEGVIVDGQELPLDRFCYSLQDTWISLAEAPQDSVTIQYRASDTKDMAVSNWDGSTYMFYNSPTGIFDGFTAVPLEIELHQAYPNPFNALTNISFTIKNPGRLKIDIFDLNGRLVENLVDRYFQAGTHSKIFDAAEISSGMYFYRLKSSAYSDTKQMLLLK